MQECYLGWEKVSCLERWSQDKNGIASVAQCEYHCDCVALIIR